MARRAIRRATQRQTPAAVLLTFLWKSRGGGAYFCHEQRADQQLQSVEQ
jgi:hypothetical protein